MKEESRVFKFIWRINSLIILLIGLLGLIILTFGFYKFYEEKVSNKKVFDIVNTQKNTIDEKFVLQDNGRLVNSSYLFTPLVSTQSYEHSYYSKSSNSIRNYLLTNLEINKSFWLFENNEQLILDIKLLTKKKYETSPSNVKNVLFEVITKDSNIDKKLTREDKVSLFLYNLKSKQKKVILTDMQKLISWQLINENELFLLYEKNDEYFSSTVDLIKITFKNSSKIPKL